MVDDGGGDGEGVLGGIVARTGSGGVGEGSEGGYMGIRLCLGIERGEEGFVDKVVVYGGGHGGEGTQSEWENAAIEGESEYHQQQSRSRPTQTNPRSRLLFSRTAQKQTTRARLLGTRVHRVSSTNERRPDTHRPVQLICPWTIPDQITSIGLRSAGKYTIDITHAKAMLAMHLLHWRSRIPDATTPIMNRLHVFDIW